MHTCAHADAKAPAEASALSGEDPKADAMAWAAAEEAPPLPPWEDAIACKS